MMGCFEGKNDWSVFLVVLLPVAAVLMILVGLLTFVWRFDLETSPSWQVGFHHLMLALYLSTTFLLASRRPFCFGGVFRSCMVGLAALVPVAVFAGSWVLAGPFAGFRDERTFDLVVVSTSSFMLIWIAVVFPYPAFVFIRALIRYWLYGEFPFGGCL